MLHAAETLTRAGIPYIGPGAAAMRLCYDKLAAAERVASAGIESPAETSSYPMVVKPRFGSDSIGVRVARSGPIPSGYLAQEWIRGTEITIAYIGGAIGAPLRIELSPATMYSFARKYLVRARRAPVEDERVRETAFRIVRLLGVDWAARVDFIRCADRLVFLECDVAPLVGAGSAFAESLAAAGMPRAEQLRRLILGAC